MQTDQCSSTPHLDDIDSAEADYEAVFDLHAAGAIGTFDSAVIRRKTTARSG